ncbi:hypothetical protein LIER_22271 [Lithospermum erythrorhizon]|uniref:Transposase n=1 Tax=Lithospermum erythrorhizon TaxID=34254 RepID=A0AAV3QUT3_LITER
MAGDCIFDGKIEMFAKRSSNNRPVGILETKPILSVTKDITRSWLIDKVLPAIREKWPESSRNSPIFIQQDNAKSHIDPSDLQFLEASKLDGFDIRLRCQPPNSLEWLIARVDRSNHSTIL